MKDKETQVKEIETIIKSNLAEGSYANAFAKKVATQIVEHYKEDKERQLFENVKVRSIEKSKEIKQALNSDERAFEEVKPNIDNSKEKEVIKEVFDDKEKQIKLLIKRISKIQNKGVKDIPNFTNIFIDNQELAEELLKHYQPKLPKGSVVLSKEEWEEYQKFKSFMRRNDWESIEHIETTLDKCQKVLYQRLQREYKKGCKKGKEKMKNRIFKKLFAINGRARADIPYYKVVELAKQFGYEIKE